MATFQKSVAIMEGFSSDAVDRVKETYFLKDGSGLVRLEDLPAVFACVGVKTTFYEIRRQIKGNYADFTDFQNVLAKLSIGDGGDLKESGDVTVEIGYHASPARVGGRWRTTSFGSSD